MILDDIYDEIINGNAPATVENIEKALADGLPANEVLNDACIPAMGEVGRQFEMGDRFVPEMLISARAMQAGLDILKPQLADADVNVVGTVVMGTVAGDLHDIGKNLTGMMLEGAGFQVIDLGTDVAPQGFVDAVKEHNPNLLGLSALLTTTMAAIGETLEALTQAGVRDQVKVIVGGAPVTEEFAQAIGADGFAADAGSAPRVAKALLGID